MPLPYLSRIAAYWLYLLLSPLGLVIAFWPVDDDVKVTAAPASELRATSSAPVADLDADPRGVHLRVIGETEVGDRVVGRDPQIDDAERAHWEEPDWDQWLKVSLVMRKGTGDELKVELLRPEDWLINRLRFVVDEPASSGPLAPTQPDLEADDDSAEELLSLCSTPWRPYRQHIAAMTIEAALSGWELTGLVVDLDLHEIGATGEAIVTAIEPAPPVRPGGGRVVTGKFSHKSGDVIDLKLVSAAGDYETLGVTSNHPFWSEDREDYVQAGELLGGERLLTYSGDTKRVVSKLPRPGPTPVFNLEVHGEHVYHVGVDGVLVHNSKGYDVDFGNGVTYRDSLDDLGAPKKAVENLPTVTFSSRTHPELAENIRHAQAAGHPSVLTHGGDSAVNRAASLEGVPNIKPLSRDEYPFASSVEGGAGAWVGHVPASQQNSQGGILSNFFRRNKIKPGDKYRVNTD